MSTNVDNDHDSTADEAPGGWSNRTLIAFIGAIVVVTFAITAAVASIGGPQTHGPVAISAATHAGVGPLDLSTVSAQIAGHYRFAESHLIDYQQIPCWCGCEQFLGHRNLADCFVRADGAGFEAHAAGCGVCNGEAAIAERMLAEGRSPGDVKIEVDQTFGASAITVPPSTS